MFSSHVGLHITGLAKFQVTIVALKRLQLEMDEVNMIVHVAGGTNHQLRTIGTSGPFGGCLFSNPDCF